MDCVEVFNEVYGYYPDHIIFCIDLNNASFNRDSDVARYLSNGNDNFFGNNKTIFTISKDRSSSLRIFTGTIRNDSEYVKLAQDLFNKALDWAEIVQKNINYHETDSDYFTIDEGKTIEDIELECYGGHSKPKDDLDEDDSFYGIYWDGERRVILDDGLEEKAKDRELI